MKIILFRLFNAEDEQGRQTGRMVKMYVVGGMPNCITYTQVKENAVVYDSNREAEEAIDYYQCNKLQKEQI